MSDEYKYGYSGSNLVLTSWVARWPKEDGQGYESEDYREYDKFYWENGNVVTFLGIRIGWSMSIVRWRGLKIILYV